MTIPKNILSTIKDIEELGSKLSLCERELYKFLEENYNDVYNELEQELDFLFHSHDGSDLIDRLKLL